MKPLTVAIDLRLAGYRAGGIARYATELAAALSRRQDFNVVPIRSQRDPASDSLARRVRTPPHNRFERFAIEAELLAGRFRPDVFHATDFIAPRFHGVPVVATVHDLEFQRHPDYLDDSGKRYYGQIEQSREWTDAWITPSQWTADDLSSTFGISPELITVVPHGVPSKLTLIPPVPRHLRKPAMLCVGTVEPRKRHDLLLDALELMERPPYVEIVGMPGWQSADLNSRIDRTAWVTWHKDIDDTGLWQLYRNAFAVVVPSESEGFGFAALEAMAAGTPLVSSGRGALPEVTGDAALVPDSDDPQGWATALQLILDNEQLWNELSLFGQRRARCFSWDAAATATAAVYKRLRT